MKDAIKSAAAGLPDGPGIYLFLGQQREALYVGKAANLRARVRSYLKPGGDGRFWLRFLSEEACELEYVATATEQEALLLENTVIKKRQPRFNIKLRDDKAFLLLRLDRHEPWPWYRFVRRRRDDGAHYIGPFASAKAVRRTLHLLHKIVPLRDCADAVFRNRVRPCLKYEIGRCPAPCVGRIEPAAYREQVERSLRILSGGAAPLLAELTAQMVAAANQMEFERAQVLKEQLAALQRVAEPQHVVADAGDEDAIGLHRRGNDVTVAFLAFRGGVLEHCRRHQLVSDLPEDLLLADVLGRLYEGDRFVPSRVLVPCAPAEAGMVQQWLAGKRAGKVELLVPQRGARRRHFELAQQNASLAGTSHDPSRRGELGSEQLRKLLHLSAPPLRLHCMDVSTNQGKDTVASRVSCTNGEPERAQYRRFRISLEHAGDDFAAMTEAVTRSLALCLEREDEPLPDLLVVDGGAGQLASAKRALRELGLDEIPCCGLAKSRLRGVGEARARSRERIFVPGRETPIALADGAPETLLLAALRDEAHRFAITYHRQVRGRLSSELDAIPGIGPTRRKRLLAHFGSLPAVQAASREQLAELGWLPAAVAEAIYRAFERC